MEIKKTSLNKLHQSNNAKFVEFAGYEMPIQYSKGIIEEHKFTRSHSGIFDVSHMGQLFIYGDETLTDELEKIFPLDLKNLKQNCSKYSFLMNEDAGIYDDLIITKIEEGYLIILNAACKVFLYLFCLNCANNSNTGETTNCSAEGANTPETLRQKDRTY